MTDFTDEDLLEEISAFFPEHRKPGDLDVKQIRARFGVSNNTVARTMERLEESGDWQILKVYNPESGRICKVLRKVV